LFLFYVERPYAARGSLSPQAVKRAATSRLTDSGFKKSYENNKSKD